MVLVSPDNKVFDDTLEDIGGSCVFDFKKTSYGKDYPWFRSIKTLDWHEAGKRFYKIDTKKPLYVRFVDPQNERFGSIAIAQPSRYYSRWSNDKNSLTSWNATTYFSGELKWNKRSNSPNFWSSTDNLEVLLDYDGDTVWQFDRDRKKRAELVYAEDRLGRRIQVGDFITYILYQFDGGGAAGIYFGTVTNIEIDGSVWAKNVGLSSSDRVADMKIKDNKLITILSDDLMKQLMIAKLSSN